MRDGFVRSFASPDEVIEMDRLRAETLDVGGITFGRDVHQPGWRWSSDVKPAVGTEWCESRHLGFVLGGRMHIVTGDGLEFEVSDGDVYDIPSGHDAWVVGDEPMVAISWMGVRSWLAPLQALKERVLVTIVFTDIVDSTGTARHLGDRMWGDLVASHNQRLADVVDRFRGRLAKFTGDGMLALFDGAARAVRCAVSCRPAVADLGLTIRAGVHTGEIEIAGNEVHGVAVHEASRILGLAGDDEVLVSDLTAGLAGDASLTFVDRGEHQLRGIDVSRRLFAVTD